MATATLGGFPLLDGAVSWPLRAGVNPVQQEFEVTIQAAVNLTEGGLRPVDLVLGTIGSQGVTIRSLYVLQRRPADTPHTMLVRVVDRRWFWDRDHIDRHFNTRRNVGYRRVSAGFNRPEIDPLDPDIAYKPYTLDGADPWNPKRAIEDLYESISQPEKNLVGSSAPLRIAGDVSKLGHGDLPLENVHLDDNGAVAFNRLLQFIPGAQVTLTADGEVFVYSIASGRDREIMENMGSEQDGGGHAEFIPNSRTRPSAVHVLFTPEVEMRFDFNEPARRGASVARGTEDPFIENVLPVPDFSLQLAGGKPKVAQGTWITFSEAMDAWGVIPNFGPLDYPTIRRALVPYLDLWQGLRQAGRTTGDADWGSRIAAVEQNFRSSYRINPRVNEMFESIRAYRAATINPEVGTRAPSVAFSNWSVVATQRFMAVQLAGGSDFAYATNFTSFPASGILDSSARAAPAKVSIADEDQGIIRLDFLMDQNRVHEQLLPSHIDNIPTGTISPVKAMAFNEYHRGRVPELSASHKLATVLTVIPGSPNSDGRLFRLVRTPNDVQGVLPSSLQGGLGSAHGPPLEVRVGAGWETARFAWVDSDSSRIKRAVGATSGVQSSTVNDIADLCINLGAQQGAGDPAASLDAIATAVAASVYAGFADRVEGSKSTKLTHKATVEGFIDEVNHRVMPSGEAITSASIPERRPGLDMMGFMPSSTRNYLLKVARAGR